MPMWLAYTARCQADVEARDLFRDREIVDRNLACSAAILNAFGGVVEGCASEGVPPTSVAGAYWADGN
jgi:hypothetical protein